MPPTRGLRIKRGVKSKKGLNLAQDDMESEFEESASRRRETEDMFVYSVLRGKGTAGDSSRQDAGAVGGNREGGTSPEKRGTLGEIVLDIGEVKAYEENRESSPSPPQLSSSPVTLAADRSSPTLSTSPSGRKPLLTVESSSASSGASSSQKSSPKGVAKPLAVPTLSRVMGGASGWAAVKQAVRNKEKLKMAAKMGALDAIDESITEEEEVKPKRGRRESRYGWSVEESAALSELGAVVEGNDEEEKEKEAKPHRNGGSSSSSLALVRPASINMELVKRSKSVLTSTIAKFCSDASYEGGWMKSDVIKDFSFAVGAALEGILRCQMVTVFVVDGGAVWTTSLRMTGKLMRFAVDETPTHLKRAYDTEQHCFIANTSTEKEMYQPYLDIFSGVRAKSLLTFVAKSPPPSSTALLVEACNLLDVEDVLTSTDTEVVRVVRDTLAEFLESSSVSFKVSMSESSRKRLASTTGRLQDLTPKKPGSPVGSLKKRGSLLPSQLLRSSSSILNGTSSPASASGSKPTLEKQGSQRRMRAVSRQQMNTINRRASTMSNAFMNDPMAAMTALDQTAIIAGADEKKPSHRHERRKSRYEGLDKEIENELKELSEDLDVLGGVGGGGGSRRETEVELEEVDIDEDELPDHPYPDPSKNQGRVTWKLAVSYLWPRLIKPHLGYILFMTFLQLVLIGGGLFEPFLRQPIIDAMVELQAQSYDLRQCYSNFSEILNEVNLTDAGIPVDCQVFQDIIDVEWQGFIGSLVNISFFIIGKLFLNILLSYMNGVFSARLAYAAQTLVVDTLIRQETPFYDFYSTGQLMSRLTQDTPNLIALIKAANPILFIAGGPIKLIVSAVLCFYIDWRFAIIVLADLPLLGVISYFWSKYLRKFFVNIMNQVAQCNAVSNEIIANVRVIHTFWSHTKEVSRYRVERLEQKRLYEKLALLTSTVGQVQTLLSLGMEITRFYVGAILLVDPATNFTFGRLEACQSYADMINDAKGAIVGTIASLQETFGKCSTLMGMMMRKPADTDGLDDNGKPLPRIRKKLKGRVDFKDVFFRYPIRPNVVVFKNITFSILPGEHVAFVGPSGTGKSTIFQLLLGMYRPEKGTIWVDRQRLDYMDPQYFRSQISAVTQEPTLFNCSIEDNILYGRSYELPVVSRDDVEKAARQAYAHDFISKLSDGYDTQVGEQGAQLSGGQKQRIAIARAIMKETPILLLDEITSALDAESEKLVTKSMDVLTEKKTVLLITHRYRTIQKVDKIVVINGGEVKEVGSHKELMEKKGLYFGLYEQNVEKTREEIRRKTTKNLKGKLRTRSSSNRKSDGSDSEGADKQE
eukprot:CAMPEP_0113873400 /NCGR_PEP_ID=MMETSP0780_2-20120614/3746_1 /TAXON_ID=652834 /ORGANISM="Palpitomonas bilix" /LENGTH=1322 /DNA_ID=CAMNT_0000859035 /DNA_START=107 /DNA_END=4075 /DNA_ORIENTATION=- /assembly_acc=CAM_ASM_000599